MGLFNFKTKQYYKDQCQRLSTQLQTLNNFGHSLQERLKWHEDSTNKYLFRNTKQDGFNDAVFLAINLENKTQNPNATLFCSDDNAYLYISKKLTEGYKYLSINYRNGAVRFFLNNDQVGLEIDTNNRVKDKAILSYLKEYFGFTEEKNEIFFEKIEIK